MKVKVLVVDDSAVYRELLARELEREGEFEVIGRAADPIIAKRIIAGPRAHVGAPPPPSSGTGATTPAPERGKTSRLLPPASTPDATPTPAGATRVPGSGSGRYTPAPTPEKVPAATPRKGRTGLILPPE